MRTLKDPISKEQHIVRVLVVVLLVFIPMSYFQIRSNNIDQKYIDDIKDRTNIISSVVITKSTYTEEKKKIIDEPEVLNQFSTLFQNIVDGNKRYSLYDIHLTLEIFDNNENLITARLFHNYGTNKIILLIKPTEGRAWISQVFVDENNYWDNYLRELDQNDFKI